MNKDNNKFYKDNNKPFKSEVPNIRVVKGLLSMSSDLSTKKERKSFFNTLIDRVIDPCIRMDMNEAAIISVLDAVDHAVGEMMKSTDPTTYESAWKRFTIVVKSSVKIMFDHLD